MRIIHDHPLTYPDFLIVGAAKSGTTSLHRYLMQHPELYLPTIKETWFFNLVDNPNRAILRYHPCLPTNLLSYLGLFATARADQVCGEVTPSYLHHYERSIRNIRRLHPRWQDLRIVMVLREPLAKLLSHYHYVHRYKLDPDRLDLMDSLHREREGQLTDAHMPDLWYLENSTYAPAVSAYLEQFPQTKIYLYDDLVADQDGLLSDLCDFLGVAPFSFDTRRTYNRGKVRRVPRGPVAARLVRGLDQLKASPVPNGLLRRARHILTRAETDCPAALAYLKPIIRRDVRQLQGLLNRDLSHWLARYG